MIDARQTTMPRSSSVTPLRLVRGHVEYCCVGGCQRLNGGRYGGIPRQDNLGDNDALHIVRTSVRRPLVGIEREAKVPAKVFDASKPGNEYICNGDRLRKRSFGSMREHFRRSSRPSGAPSHSSEGLSNHAVGEPANHNVRVGTYARGFGPESDFSPIGASDQSRTRPLSMRGAA